MHNFQIHTSLCITFKVMYITVKLTFVTFNVTIGSAVTQIKIVCKIINHGPLWVWKLPLYSIFLSLSLTSWSRLHKLHTTNSDFSMSCWDYFYSILTIIVCLCHHPWLVCASLIFWMFLIIFLEFIQYAIVLLYKLSWHLSRPTRLCLNLLWLHRVLEWIWNRGPGFYAASV